MITAMPLTAAILTERRPALFFYEGIIKKLVIGAKFYSSLQHAEVLMRLAQQAAMHEVIKAIAPDCISAVPTHWLNRIRRGVDLPQLFGQLLSRMFAVPFVSCLRRVNYFHHQVLATSKGERVRGIRGAFSIRRKKNTYGRILLVDDIVTTGATFDESRKMLRAKSDDVVCLALARTP
jgi:predicted amidophosphoribosyltransferase